MKSLKHVSIVLAALSVSVLFSCQPSKPADSAEVAQESNDATIEDRNDRKNADFVVNEIANNYAEINLAKLALSRSKDEAIQKMAKHQIEERTKANTELKAYASKAAISVPSEETDQAKRDLESLTQKKAETFEENWCEMAKDNQEKSIDAFETRLDKTEDPELKNWIASTLPALKSHLETLKTYKARASN
jgi:putative membrane protein